MSDIDKNEIIKLASLSKLHLSSEEQESFLKDLNKTKNFVSILSKLDTKNVTPLVQINKVINDLREDKVHSHPQPKKLISMNNKEEKEFFTISNVIKKEHNK